MNTWGIFLCYNPAASKKQKGGTFKLFAEAFHELVLPELERINSQVGDIKIQMTTKGDLDSIERKLDAQQDRLDRHGKIIERDEKDLKWIKAKISLAWFSTGLINSQNWRGSRRR